MHKNLEERTDKKDKAYKVADRNRNTKTTFLLRHLFLKLMWKTVGLISASEAHGQMNQTACNGDDPQ